MAIFKKSQYYDNARLLAENATYAMAIGERSNGKTYSFLKYMLKRYINNDEKCAIIRRWEDDFRGKRGANMWAGLVNNDEVKTMTGGEWTGIYYYSGMWYLSRQDEKGNRIKQEDPFCYAFALSTMEHDKSTSYDINNVFFDEFIPVGGQYLRDEFIVFQNVLSTIIRQRDDVKIFMAANTISKSCIYFSEMGLDGVTKMKPGDIQVYKYGESGLTVAVEFTDTPAKKKPSDKYFAFNNPKLSMITGEGSPWQIGIYPHKPEDFLPKDIIFTYFIVFERNILQCEIVETNTGTYTYIHRKTTPLKNPERDLIYTPDYDPRPNYRRKITKATDKIDRRIQSYFVSDKVFYQDNDTGETVQNYLRWCSQN